MIYLLLILTLTYTQTTLSQISGNCTINLASQCIDLLLT